MRNLGAVGCLAIFILFGGEARATPPRPGYPPVRGQQAGPPGGGRAVDCSSVAGTWIAQDRPEILTITADCQGTNNICGIEADVDTSGLKPGTRNGRVILRAKRIKDPKCPQNITQIGCTFETVDKETVTVQCDGSAKSVFVKAL